MAAIPDLWFSNGQNIPCLGLGTFQPSWSKSREVEDIVLEAISLGYRHLDCAFAYCNEKDIGKAIQQSIENGIVKREDLFITTKLWSTYHRPEKVEECCRKSLSDLQLDYVDLYLMHWPFARKEGAELFPLGDDGKPALMDIDFVDTFKAMQALVDKGLVKSLGVSNFNSKQIRKLLDLDVKHKPVTNQVEMNPYLRNEKLRRFCAENGVILTAYAPLGSPNALSKRVKDSPNVLGDQVINEIGQKHGKSAGQITLRWGVQRGYPVIPKSASSQRLKENLDIFDFTLSEEEMEAINKVDKGIRLCRHESIKECPYYPFKEEF